MARAMTVLSLTGYLRHEASNAEQPGELGGNHRFAKFGATKRSCFPNASPMVEKAVLRPMVPMIAHTPCSAELLREAHSALTP